MKQSSHAAGHGPPIAGRGRRGEPEHLNVTQLRRCSTLTGVLHGLYWSAGGVHVVRRCRAAGCVQEPRQEVVLAAPVHDRAGRLTIFNTCQKEDIMKSRWLLVIVSLAMMGSIHAGCGGGTANEADGGGTPDGADATEEDGTTKQVILHGAVQKGPFVVGSSVQVSLLNPNLTPTGQVFNTQTINDRGEFDISFQAVGPVALEGAGYYYNEVTGQLSSSNLTLRAFFVPTQGGAQSAYINMVTHLTTERIKALVAGGTSFSAAVAQAETELRAELAITYPGFSPTISGVGMNVVGGDNDNNAYLMAVSSVFIQTAVNRTAAGGSLESNLQELLNTATFDFADGTFAGPLKQEITAALLGVDVRLVTQQFTKRLSQIGAVVAVPDMNRVLDQDRDGLPNSLDNCPITPNPGQENVKGGAYGDVCSPTWILIPAGTSMMGCVPQDPDRKSVV